MKFLYGHVFDNGIGRPFASGAIKLFEPCLDPNRATR